jgi:hypothetical protein
MKTCAQSGKPLKDKRAEAKFCSEAHRKAYFRHGSVLAGHGSRRYQGRLRPERSLRAGHGGDRGQASIDRSPAG